MYIPETIPTTLAEMMTFLQPMVAGGFFDMLEYDNNASPTKIECTYAGEKVLELSYSGSGWLFKPFIDYNTPASPAGRTPQFTPGFMARCTGGAFFTQRAYNAGATSQGQSFMIAKTKAGNTAFISCEQPMLTSTTVTTLYVSAFGDSTAAPGYSSGFRLMPNGLSLDRTTLQTIPVFGPVGSTDYVTTCKFRATAQYMEAGLQLIGGKRYYCAGLFAISDEGATA